MRFAKIAPSSLRSRRLITNRRKRLSPPLPTSRGAPLPRLRSRASSGGLGRWSLQVHNMWWYEQTDHNLWGYERKVHTLWWSRRGAWGGRERQQVTSLRGLGRASLGGGGGATGALLGRPVEGEKDKRLRASSVNPPQASLGRPVEGERGNRLRACQPYGNNYFTKMCRGSEAGSCLRLVDLCITQL